MKRLIIFLFVILWANETQDILKLINMINKYHFKYKNIPHLYDPFGYKKKILHHKIVVLHKMRKRRKKIYKLEAIFQNMVKINNKWYNINSKIDGYKIVKKGGMILLINKYKIIRLSTPNIIKVN
jgi:hypothetical protein